MKIKIQAPRGMKDIIYPDSDYFLKLKDLMIDFSLKYGFKYIETPIVEDEKTFTLSLGQTSDVVEKEMFYLKGKENKTSYVLRPESTSQIVRAYFENGMGSWPQPVNLFYVQKMYRKERPQYARLREHTQWGLEILNTEDAFADFFIIYLFSKFLTNLKIKDHVVKINSLGCLRCRSKFKKALLSYYKPLKRKLCSDCQKRLKINPLRMLDCKNEKDQELKEEAPNILDYLCKSCEIHFQKVLELLDYFKINYLPDKTLVRGFDYYQKTVFEIFVDGEKVALASGGRYDLGEVISSQPLPSFGGAFGVERLKIVLDKLNQKLFKINKPKIFIAFAGEEIRNKAFSVYLELQEAGFCPLANFFKVSLSSQLDYANKNQVKYALIFGFQELGKEEVILKNMEYGNQEILKIKHLVKDLKKILKNND